ncbi:DUF6538 domain-containing protein [Yoonia sp. R78084]|uniref:DUF6538 domain-containing protein n=1 Tax=Yoonia sp. R78084 TaxID=3093869 RepID=UPI0037DCB177
MSGHTRLYRRGAVYYHRAAVPQDIVATYGKREETFSLRTSDYSEALRRVRIEAVKVDRKFDEHRLKLAQEQEDKLQELTLEQIATIKATYLHHLLDEDEEVRIDSFEEVEDRDGQSVRVSPHQFEPRPTFDEYDTLVEDMDEVTRFNLARGKSDPFYRSEAEEVLTWEGIELRLDPASLSWPRLVRALQEASVEASEAIRRRNKGDVVLTPEAPRTVTQGASDAPLFSAAVKLWADEKSRGAWSPKVRNDYLSWTDLFVEIAGDRPVNTYRKDDARAFKSVLMKLPANSRKKRETRGLPATVAAQKAEQLGLEPMGASTVNKALSRVGTFWNWAEAHFDDVTSNLMKGLKINTGVAPRDQRNAFSSSQLQRLFSSPLFTGCRSERFCSEAGSLMMTETAKFWLPLLGLFSGARLNELCQLATGDVKAAAGIPFLDITDEGDGQNVKTSSGKRQIAVHSELIALGFLDFVAKRRKQNEPRLFPELRQDATGYFSGEFSKFFSRYLERIGLKTAKTSFHSFRHNFEDACRNGEVPPNIMDALQGHAERGMAGRYGDGRYRLDLLKNNIEKVTYAELKLTHIAKFQHN